MSVGPCADKPAVFQAPASTTTSQPGSASDHPPPPSPPTAQYNQVPEEPGTAAAAAVATAAAALQSHNHTPTPNNTSNGKKRRASGQPGSRGVANLTPEQLAKKRANDREAQRAIRERTRNTIEALERRIRELESQQPFQELQRVMQERDAARAESEELRRRLGSIAGIVGASQRPDLNELAALTAQQTPLPPLHQQQQAYPPPHQELPQTYESHPQPQPQIHPDLRSPQSSPNAQTSPPSRSGSAGPTYQFGSASRRWSPSLDRSPNASFTARTIPQNQHSNGERQNISFLLDSNQTNSSTSPKSQSQQSPITPDQPPYARVTNVGPAACPLDYLLIDFHRSRTKMLRDGMSRLEVIGPDYPAFSALIDPSSREEQHPVSGLLINVLSKFPDIAELPEKVAVLYVMFLVMRWLICPCAECYERLPTMCRPVPEQYERSHGAWADYLPWPHMRKMLCVGERQVNFEDWFVPYTTTLSLNWTLPKDCILLPIPGKNELKLNPAFEHHLRDLNNWSLGSMFRKHYPEFVDESVKIKEET